MHRYRPGWSRHGSIRRTRTSLARWASLPAAAKQTGDGEHRSPLPLTVIAPRAAAPLPQAIAFGRREDPRHGIERAGG